MHVRTAVLLAALIAYSLSALAADITLVKHARRAKTLPPNEYVVREGDTLRKILMEEYQAKEEDLPYLYKRFRQENPSIANLDYIPADTKIMIPMIGDAKTSQEALKPQPQQEFEVKEVSPNEYVIQQGEYLAKILRKIYGASDERIFHEYIGLVKKLNPEITNPNLIMPGQKLRLPEIKQVLTAANRAQTPTLPSSPVSATTSGVRLENKPTPLPFPEVAATKSHDREDISASVSPQAQAATPAPSINQGVSTKTAKAQNVQDLRVVKGSVLPALKALGGTQRDKGTYYMPITGGTSLSINSSEVPVMELDTGRKIIFDMNAQITPEMKRFIEKAFPSFTIISGSQADLEGLMDKVLNVSGYFSINKDASPLLVGSEEKLRFFGKWIVYKDFSRRNVFVVNLLGNEEQKTPSSIRSYAGHFGIDLIEIGGKDPGRAQKKPIHVVDLKHSYPVLFNRLKIPFETNKEIALTKGGVVKISYKAPVLLGNVILTDVMPEQDMVAMLGQQSFDVLDMNTIQLDEVLRKIGLEFEGPPLKMTVAQGRTELEIPGLQLGGNVILLKNIDKDITAYIAASGMKVLAW
ncbi:MAG: LysM peptidoglycan-binding domain-containing protein [Desulfomonilia bacterium]|jgi:hypothetical protein